MSRNFLTATITLLVASFTVAGCSGAAPSPVAPSTPVVVVVGASSITITGINTLSKAGERGRLTALVTFSDGRVEDQTAGAQWSSGDPDIASVSSDGNVTALADGHTMVTATFEVVSGTHRIVVDLPTGPSPIQPV